MANHRMFSNRIANSAKFLQMPAESQLLYFHMILRADDDGVVEAYPLTKLLGSPPDVIKILIARDYIRQLNEDQVVIISDWLEHNTIRADRKVNSIYKHLIPPEIKIIEPKPRSDVEDNSKRTGRGLSTVSVSEVKVSQEKLSEDRLNNISEPEARIVDKIVDKVEKPTDPAQKLFDLFYKSINPTISFNNKTEWDAARELIKEFGLENTLNKAKYAILVHGTLYAPSIATPYQLKVKLPDLMAFYKKNNQPTESKHLKL